MKSFKIAYSKVGKSSQEELGIGFYILYIEKLHHFA